jgi:hypothetical protein
VIGRFLYTVRNMLFFVLQWPCSLFKEDKHPVMRNELLCKDKTEK